MSWEREYEHWRDRGKTWGPGVDDTREQTEAEMTEHNAKMEAYRQKLRDAAVPAREIFVKAGEAFQGAAPSSADVLEGRAPVNWREKMSAAKMELCKSACESLGYSFDYPETTYGIREYREAHGRDDGTFAVSVEHVGWVANRGGNLHKCFVCGIPNLEDCLQLVADFSAIGLQPTTWYGQDFHFCTKDTGELRLELYRLYGEEEFHTKASLGLDGRLEAAVKDAGGSPKEVGGDMGFEK